MQFTAFSSAVQGTALLQIQDMPLVISNSTWRSIHGLTAPVLAAYNASLLIRNSMLSNIQTPRKSTSAWLAVGSNLKMVNCSIVGNSLALPVVLAINSSALEIYDSYIANNKYASRLSDGGCGLK